VFLVRLLTPSLCQDHNINMVRNHYVRTDRIDRYTMLFVYCLDAIFAVVFTVFNFFPFYIVACTSKLILDCFFILGAVKSVKRFNRLHLFLVWFILQFFVIAVGIFLVGLMYVAFNFLLLLVYLRRYFYLSMVKNDFLSEETND